MSLEMLLLFTFVLAIFLGFELISKVPSQLHTPLMSGANAISGITIVGALVAATILIYGMGTAYMAWLLELEAWEAITVGALPFIPGELLKMAAAIAIVKRGVVSPLRS